MVDLRSRDFVQQTDGAEQGQVTGRLRRVMDEVQASLGLIVYEVRERLGMNDDHQPALAEELRRGRQEMLDVGRDLSDISKDLQVLVQQEMQLAKAEMGQQLQLSSRALVWGVTAGVFGFFTLVFLSLTAMFALALVLPLWVAALATAALFAILAMSTGFIAYGQFRKVRLIPQRTLESVREDVKWVGSQLRSNGR